MTCPHCKKNEVVVKQLGSCYFALCLPCRATWAARLSPKEALDAVARGETRIPPRNKV